MKRQTANKRRTKNKKTLTAKRNDDEVCSKNPNCCNCNEMCLSQKRPRINRSQKSNATSSFDIFLTAAWDDDDDLFLSSPSAGHHIDNCSNNDYMNQSQVSKSVATTKATKAVANASSGDHIHHIVVKNQQQDDILQEM